MTSIVEQKYWDEYYAANLPRYVEERVVFRSLFGKFLRPGGTCFEVGCYPGNFLIYLSRHFGYTAHGIDLTPNVATLLPMHLQANGAKAGTFHHADFLTFQAPQQYDVVCSFGFIEHFSDYPAVIRKHIDLVAPGGTLVLACPNFRGLQYPLHWMLDRPNLKRHVIQAMNANRWRPVLEAAGMSIEYIGYHRTADFWVEPPKGGKVKQFTVRTLKRLCKRIDRAIHWPNPLISPYVICIARKGA